MKTKFYVIFVAGGSGTRMGAGRPKQFLELRGKMILRRSIEKFYAAVPSMHAVTVLPREYIEPWRNYCTSSSVVFSQTFVEGGLTRFQSVRNALEKIPDGVIVAVHDGVRPFVSESLIVRMLERMETCDALIPVLPVTDTLRSTDPDREDPDRSKVVAVQTPQFFRSEVLKKAYRQAYDLSFTDDASVVAKSGVPVEMIEGERFNIKITTPEDLLLGDYILSI